MLAAFLAADGMEDWTKPLQPTRQPLVKRIRCEINHEVRMPKWRRHSCWRID